MAGSHSTDTEAVAVFDQMLELPSHQDRPLIAFPRGKTVADFDVLTGRQLNLFVNRAAKHYHKLGLRPSEPNTIITLVGPSNLDYVVTQFALSRLGFGVFLLSTRLSPEACLKLMKESNSQVVVQSTSALANLGNKIRKLDSSITVHLMAAEGQYRSTELDASSQPPSFSEQRRDEERRKDTALIFHSSGTTGFPKALPITHEKLLEPLPFSDDCERVMTVSPLFHSYAGRSTLTAMMYGRCIYLANPEVPQVSTGLLEMLQQAKPSIFFAVPYNLKLVAESPGGLNALASCTYIVSAGSKLSDELGQRLIEAGVNVNLSFAGTETGPVGDSLGREPGDNSWDYIRISPRVAPHVQYKPVGDNVFEFVYLESMPSLSASNSDDPPGSFHSKDCFTPHPTIKNAWKFAYRVDDRITLDNGEKVLPLPIEGTIKEEKIVKEAVMFGIGRSVPGVLLFRSPEAEHLSTKDYFDQVWPAIEKANRAAETFSRISKDMVIVLPADAKLPAADKGSIMRATVYQKFEKEIEQAYERLDSGPATADGQQLDMSQDELEQWLLEKCNDDFEMDLPDTTTQLYQAGMDSLRATQLRALIINNVALDKGTSTQFTVSKLFEAGTIQNLAAIITGLKTGDKSLANGHGQDELELMEELKQKYSSFQQHKSENKGQAKGTTVLLTGATGSLGAHLLSQLIKLESVVKVVCLARGENPRERIEESLRSRQLPTTMDKVDILEADLAEPQFGLDGAVFSGLRQDVTHVIHAAWPVNFQLRLSAFEPQIAGLKNLIDFSLTTSGGLPARLLFCSSVSTAMATPGRAVTKEKLVEDFNQALDQGYARSKLVSEHMVDAATKAGADAHILRIGQIIGDTETGIWNSTEAFPLTIQSANTLKMLPKLDVTCSWIPVDTLASAILELLFLPEDSKDFDNLVWNLQNPRTFNFTHDLLPTLKKEGLQFDSVDVQTWLKKLKQYNENTPDEEALRLNPAVKLIDFYEKTYGHDSADKENGTNGDTAERGGNKQKQEVVFETTVAKRDSVSLRQTPDVLESGLMGKIVQNWMKTWPAA